MADKTINCKRCGKCCLAIAFSLICDEDIARWNAENRDDIFKIIDFWHPLWAGDHLINAADGRPIHGCPFFDFEGTGGLCRIYETRPIACRDYVCGSSYICPQWSACG
jgi:Fe-S-cluster containining protein